VHTKILIGHLVVHPKKTCVGFRIQLISPLLTMKLICYPNEYMFHWHVNVPIQCIIFLMYYDKSKIVAIYVEGQRANLPVSNKPCTKVSSKVLYFCLSCRSIGSECVKTNGILFLHYNHVESISLNLPCVIFN
jgi:hypothetical protein